MYIYIYIACHPTKKNSKSDASRDSSPTGAGAPQGRLACGGLQSVDCGLLWLMGCFSGISMGFHGGFMVVLWDFMGFYLWD